MPSANNPTIELLTPEPDGVTTDFSTSQAYKSGTVSVWVNGQRRVASLDNGFTEAGGTTITLKEVPLSGDTLQAEYEVL